MPFDSPTPQQQQGRQSSPGLFSICEVLPDGGGLLLLAGYNAVEERKLRQLGVTHCVDATNLPRALRIPNIEYLAVKIEDSLIADIRRHFEPVAAFVRSANETGGKALIYCAAGISRAATLCIMCLVINEKFTLREAYQHVLRARPIIAPNIGFWRQMIDWEAANAGPATVRLLTGMRVPIPDVYLNRSTVVADRLPLAELTRRAVGRNLFDGQFAGASPRPPVADAAGVLRPRSKTTGATPLAG